MRAKSAGPILAVLLCASAISPALASGTPWGLQELLPSGNLYGVSCTTRLLPLLDSAVRRSAASSPSSRRPGRSPRPLAAIRSHVRPTLLLWMAPGRPAPRQIRLSCRAPSLPKQGISGGKGSRRLGAPGRPGRSVGVGGAGRIGKRKLSWAMPGRVSDGEECTVAPRAVALASLPDPRRVQAPPTWFRRLRRFSGHRWARTWVTGGCCVSLSDWVVWSAGRGRRVAGGCGG